MFTVEESVVINRPVEEVFAFVADNRNDVRWQDGLLEVRVAPDGPVGQGTQVTEVRKFMGRRIESTRVISEFVPNVRIVAGTKDGPVDVGGYTTFEPIEGGTRVTQHMEMQTKGFFALADPLVASSMRRNLKASSGDLKDLLENGVPVAS